MASCEVVGWLEQSAPKNVEQRLCALFLSVRLARHFGEALTAWGYDLEDPLKEKGEGLGESVALEKLKLMGRSGALESMEKKKKRKTIQDRFSSCRISLNFVEFHSISLLINKWKGM